MFVTHVQGSADDHPPCTGTRLSWRSEHQGGPTLVGETDRQRVTITLMLGANCKKPTHIPCAKILWHFPRLSISYWFPEMQRLEHLVLLQKTNENHVRTDVKG